MRLLAPLSRGLRDGASWTKSNNHPLVFSQIPDNLTQIRAYVRWEEAGKPQNTTVEWQKVRSLGFTTRFHGSHLIQKAILQSQLQPIICAFPDGARNRRHTASVGTRES